MARQIQPTVTVYRETLEDIVEKHNTTFAELSRRCGYSSSFISICFSRNGNDKAKMKLPLAVAICYALGIKQEELTKAPKPSFPERHKEELERGKEDTKSQYVTKEELEEAIKKIEIAIRESTNFIHCDLRELLKVWTPKQEPISIGGDASK